MKHDALKKPWLWAALILALAFGLKLWLELSGSLPFNADEAVVALMGRHILQGARPLFFYGQAYMGSLDAILVALGFSFFGQHVWVIRLVQALSYAGVLLTTVWIGRRVFHSWAVGLLAMLLLALPAVNMTLYTTISLGGYVEALLLGNLSLMVGLALGRTIRRGGGLGRLWLWAAFGFLTGLGLWAFGLALVYSFSVGVYLLVLSLTWLRKGAGAPGHSARRRLGTLLVAWGVCFIPAFLLGSSPWWGFALTQGFQGLLSELRGGAIAGVEGLPWVLQAGQHLVSLLLLGSTVVFGLRPPWSVEWLVLPLLPFVLIFWLAVLVSMVRSLRQARRFSQDAALPGDQVEAPPGTREPPDAADLWLLVGVMLTLIAGFLFTPFGADPSGRYFLPLAIPLALFAAEMIANIYQRQRALGVALVALLLVYHLLGTIQTARRMPPGITTQFYIPSQVDMRAMPELVDFLRQNGETHGYSNYWVSYPLAFLSQEELIFVPRLPYHLDFRYTARDDRYAPYDELVAQAGQTAYITTHHPELDERLRQGFQELGVSFQETRIGDFVIFYGLSVPVRPEQLNLPLQ